MLPLLFGGFAHAENEFPLFGFGMKCDQIVTDLDSKQPYITQTAVASFISGYLLAYNSDKWVASGGKTPSNIGKGLTSDFMISYTKDYCMHHPNSSLPLAVSSLLKDLSK